MNVTADNTVAQVALVKQVVIDLATQFRDENNFNLAVFVTVFYDYLTTLDREVRLLWGRKISLGKGIFLLNRYTSLLLFLMSFVELFPFGKGVSCVALTYTWATLAILMHIVRVAFSGVRIYAISSQNVIITWIVVLLGMAPVGANIYLFSHLESVTLLGCLPVPNISLDSMNTMVLATQCCLVMFEAIVVVVTWRRTWSGARSDVLLGNFKTSFTAAIFREGTVYFVVIESCNTLLLISSVVQKTAVVFIFRALTAAPPVLISRFYFYMDDVQNAEMTVPALPTMSPLAQAQLATLQFAHERDSLDDDVQEARSGSRD